MAERLRVCASDYGPLALHAVTVNWIVAISFEIRTFDRFTA